MLHRQTEDGLIVITQPAHAWVSGQLARHWMSQRPLGTRPSCFEDVCLAVEQHDIGFLAWEQRPSLNPATGLPHTFLELPTRTHLDIWSAGVRDIMRFGRYPALLVSHHFTGLARRMVEDKQGSDQALVRRFLARQEQLQITLTTSLQNDFHYAEVSSKEDIRAAHEFVSLLDLMSLQLLLGFREEKLKKETLARPGGSAFSMTPLNSSCSEVVVEPWPFDVESFFVVCDGKRLLERYSDERMMRRGLRAAAPVTVRIHLQSATAAIPSSDLGPRPSGPAPQP